MTTEKTSTETSIKKSKDVFRLALLGGANITHAAAEAGVTRQTGSRWLRDPELVEELRRERAAFAADATQRIAFLQRKAVDTLEKHMDAADAKVSLQAVRTALQWGDIFARRSNDRLLNFDNLLQMSPFPTRLDSEPERPPRPTPRREPQTAVPRRAEASVEEAKAAEQAKAPPERPAAIVQQEPQTQAPFAKSQQACQPDRPRTPYYKQCLNSGALNAVVVCIACFGCALVGARAARQSAVPTPATVGAPSQSYPEPEAVQEAAPQGVDQDAQPPKSTGSVKGPNLSADGAFALMAEDVDVLSRASQSVTKCNSGASPAGSEAGGWSTGFSRRIMKDPADATIPARWAA